VQYHEVKVNIEFRDKTDCYYASGAVTVPDFAECSLFVDYIYLDYNIGSPEKHPAIHMEKAVSVIYTGASKLVLKQQATSSNCGDILLKDILNYLFLRQNSVMVKTLVYDKDNPQPIIKVQRLNGDGWGLFPRSRYSLAIIVK